MCALSVIFLLVRSVASLRLSSENYVVSSAKNLGLTEYPDANFDSTTCASSAMETNFLTMKGAGFHKINAAMNDTMNPAYLDNIHWKSYIDRSKTFQSTMVRHTFEPNVDNLVCAVVTIPANPFYRVSDIVCNKGEGVETITKHVLKDPEFDGTIVQTYLKRRKTEKAGPGLLRKIIDNGNWTMSLPKKTDLVVHVRAGDRVPKNPKKIVETVKHMLHGSCENVSRIVVVTAHAFQACAPTERCENKLKREGDLFGFTPKRLRESQAGLRTFFEEFSKLGLEVAVQSHMHIDQDIAFMASAKCFIPTAGGLSKSVLVPLVQLGGGKAMMPINSQGVEEQNPKTCKY